MIEFKPSVPHYLRLRKASIALSGRIIKTLGDGEIQEAGRQLHMLEGKQIVLDSEDELAIVMDFAFYDVRRDGRNPVERFADTATAPPDSDEHMLLEGMRRARYAVFEVQETLPGVGVRVRDVLTGESIPLIDTGLSHTMSPGVVLATRVIPVAGFWMTGGAGLPVPPVSAGRIRRYLEQQFPVPEQWQVDPDRRATATAAVIRMCRAAGAGQSVRYADPGTNPGAAAAERPRIGRNDPCPCGSGHKYKKCCGPRRPGGQPFVHPGGAA